MLLMVLSVSAMVFLLTVMAFRSAAVRHDNLKRRLSSINGSKRYTLDEDIEKPFVERVIKPFIASSIKFLSNLLPKRRGDKTEKLERSLKLAGLAMDVNDYNAAKLMFTGAVLGLAAMLIFLTSPEAKLGVLIFMIAFLSTLVAPIFFLRFRINKRQYEVTNQLPDVMDLLCVSIEAGLGFDAALAKISQRLSGVLIDEFNIVLTEIQLGKPRRVALRNLVDRSPVEELSTFLTAMIQAEQLGIPIRNVMLSQSQQLRTKRRQIAEEKAMKAPVEMLLPLVIFVFPVLIIILLGPTILQLIEQFG
ncbi:MAG: type II secretion system F family protein [Christensenellales bacterium]|jgi:tight adherence protein C